MLIDDQPIDPEFGSENAQPLVQLRHLRMVLKKKYQSKIHSNQYFRFDRSGVQQDVHPQPYKILPLNHMGSLC